MNLPPCDECGHPATHLVIDVQYHYVNEKGEIPRLGDVILNKPFPGPKHKWCEKHWKPSRTAQLGFTPYMGPLYKFNDWVEK